MAFVYITQKGKKMSIKTTGVRITDSNKQRMKALIPNQSFNNIIEAMLDDVETSQTVPDDMRKSLCKKFDLDENTEIGVIVSNYLIGEKDQRVEKIKATAWGSGLIDEFGAEDQTLSTIEVMYMIPHHALTNEDGKVTLGTLAKAVRTLAAANTVAAIKAGRKS